MSNPSNKSITNSHSDLKVGKRTSIFNSKRLKRFKLKLAQYLTLTEGMQGSSEAIEAYDKLYTTISTHKGVLKCCKILKEYYSISLRYSAGQSFERMSFEKSDEDGLPLRLKPFKPYLLGTIRQKRSVLCILQLYKLVNTQNSEWKLTSITSPPLVERVEVDLDKSKTYLERVCDLDDMGDSLLNKKICHSWRRTLSTNFPQKDSVKRIEMISKLSSMHLSTKNGPNGPAIGTASVDWLAIKDEPFYQSIKELARMTDHEDLLSLLDNFENEGVELTDSDGKEVLHSRLSLKQEVGGKNRIFAIGDYFTQCVCSGFHKYLFTWLQNQVEDGTHSHNYVSQIARSWTKVGEPSVSVDLTTATDRIPVQMQAEVVASITNKEFANHWMNLMINRDFECNGEKVRYETGQPMGFLSSWAIMAVWHHMILRTSLDVLGIHLSSEEAIYLIIGDDMGSKRQDVATVYQHIVGKLCNVPISKLKGFSPDTRSDRKLSNLERSQSNKLVSCEIAKRVFINGEEITPVSPVTIQEGLEHPSDFPSLLADMSNRGITVINELGPIPGISSLGFKPKLAILLATFPYSGAPIQGVTSGGKSSMMTEQLLKGVVWSNVNIELIERLFYETIKEDLQNSLNLFYTEANQYMENSYNEDFECVPWEFKSVAQGQIYELIYRSALDTVNRVMTAWTDKMTNSSAKDIWTGKSKDPLLMKRYIGQLKIIFDLRLTFIPRSDRRERFLDEKRFSSRKVYELALRLKRMLS